MFLGKGVMKICSKFKGEHPCLRMISIKMQSKFIEITLLHGCSSVNLLYIFRKPFPKNTSGALLLYANNFQTKHYITHNHMLRFSGNFGIVKLA